jgi:hypothetical protein
MNHFQSFAGNAMSEILDYNIFSKRKYLLSTDMRYQPKISHKVVTVEWYNEECG